MQRLVVTSLVSSFLAWAALPALLADEKAKAQAEADRKTVVKGNNDFAFDLYRQLGKKEGNLFFSPYSISSALAMTYAGARGETAEQMAKTLHFTLEQERLHSAFAGLIKQLQIQDPKVSAQLHVANALWGQKGFRFREEFLQMTQDHYGAGLREMDFLGNSDAARQAINRWVEEQTKNKITDLLAPGAVDNKTRLVLTNAVYFKADWAAPFNEKFTKELPFQLTAKDKVQVPMMYQTLTTGYYEGDGAQVLDVPYCNGRWSFLVVLPVKAEDLAKVEKSLSAAWLEERIAKLKNHLVELTLPKFQLRDGFTLGKQLADLGMPLAFSRKADFTGISSQEDLSLSDVVHKTFLEVNEKGTEAAAATAVVQSVPSSMPAPLPKVVLRADRPFILVIRDNPTGTILFLSRLADPQIN